MRIYERNSSVGTQVSEAAEGEGTKHSSRDSPEAPGEYGGEAADPLHFMQVHGGAEIQLQTMEDLMPEQNALKEAVTPWEAHPGEGSWKKLWTHGEREKLILEQVCWQEL